jgi:hypothetical protein
MDYRKSKQQARLKNRVPYRYTDDAETLAHDSDTTNKGHDRTRVRTYEHVHVVHHHHEVAGIHSWLIDRRRCITRNENHKQDRRVGLHGNHPHLTSLRVIRRKEIGLRVKNRRCRNTALQFIERASF